jgi:hypothetical protein
MLNSLSSEELEFIQAIERYKAKSGKLFLSWTEVLKVVRDLGYRKAQGERRKVRISRP